MNEITKTIIKVKNESFISSGTLFINPGKFMFIKENRTADRIGNRKTHPSMLKFILNDLNSLNYKIGLIFFCQFVWRLLIGRRQLKTIKPQ